MFKMDSRKKLFILVTCVLAVALVLVGCGDSAGPKQGDTVFTPKERKVGFDTKVSNAEALADKIRTETPTSVVAGDVETENDALFTEANSAYRAGNYGAALEGYDAVLTDAPYHYGALNNKTLALLQLEKNADALQNSLLVLELFPESPSSYLNAQAAAFAAGYHESDLEASYPEVAKAVKDTTAYGGPDLYNAAEYNSLYARMEFQLDPEDKDYKDTYESLKNLLAGLSQANEDDEDIAQLTTYLEGVGMITGAIPYPK